MNNNSDIKFAIDKFPEKEAGKLFQVSGWHIPYNLLTDKIIVYLNDIPKYKLLRYMRHDVAEVFPEIKLAVKSGFVGDVYIPDDIADNEIVNVKIVAATDSGTDILIERNLSISNKLTADLKVAVSST